MNYTWRKVTKATALDDIVPENFWSGINVFVDRPHLINPKLLAADIVKTWTVDSNSLQLFDFLAEGEFCENNISKIIEQEVIENVEEVNNSALILRNLLPKQVKFFQDVLEAIVLDKVGKSATFYPKRLDVQKSSITSAFPYRFKLVDKGIILEVLSSTSDEAIIKRTVETLKWLELTVLRKIFKWCQNIPKYPIVPSLKLVSAKEYNSNLYYLKSKYADKFVKIWPEYNNTNPTKYVYEDISIAAYLITLWAEERKTLNLTEKQTFVDLGCGNGFLDHILTSEGHKGIGFDVRKRKIWEAYQPDTKLIEMTIEPSDRQLFPDYDWIIGNHADELTPWIPVIAARSSYNMRIFLLPCCFYTFDGKYARSHPELTQYQSYLIFLKTLCITMGFKVDEDRLRIPSTKRACFVCMSRIYKKENEAEVDVKRKEFITSNLKGRKFESTVDSCIKSTDDSCPGNTSCNEQSETNTLSNWISDFNPRESVECPRNCTNLDQKTIQDTVKLIMDFLLSMENYVSLKKDENIHLWNKGGKIKMEDICHLLDVEMLRSMKSQRGGFQTLIRNHGHIFEIKDCCVQLKEPSIRSALGSQVSNQKHRRNRKKKSREIMFKRKKCFFFFNHPQGCPLSHNCCTYSHDV